MTTSATTDRTTFPALTRPIRLIASDIDGTLLDSRELISPRTRKAIASAVNAGLWMVAATGRQITQIPEALSTGELTHVVGSNGAIGIEVASGDLLFEEFLDPAVSAEIVAHLTSELEGVRFSAVRDRGRRHAAEPGYLDLLSPRELTFWRVETESLADLVATPTLKLTARHPELSADDLLDILDGSGLDGFHATTSGAPFLEIAGAGVTKASGITRLCEHLGVERAEVLSAGDAKNDVELIGWAGVGVAMGNAVPEAQAVATWVTASNDQDGVALAIEHVLAGPEN